MRLSLPADHKLYDDVGIEIIFQVRHKTFCLNASETATKYQRPGLQHDNRTLWHIVLETRHEGV